MPSFSDPNSLSEIIFQGAPDHPIEMYCSDTVLDKLRTWQNRQDPAKPDTELLQLSETRGFIISYDGKSSDYWPNREDNMVGESLIREFLFQHGICQLETLTPMFYTAHYKVVAMQETEFLLVLPFPTPSNNVAGIIVICVNRHLRADAPTS